MNNIIEQMLSKYELKNTNDEINALKEIIQEIVLSGLSRGNFFNEVAFYGGTALRIFYKLDRFSEDLDFALIFPNKKFDLSKYFIYIEKELKSYGLNLEISAKQKNKNSNITSAFLKGNTLEHILKFFPNEKNNKYSSLLKNIKIKFEVDINPPSGAEYEEKYKLLPSPHQIKIYDKESLLAGKIHAILCRGWKTRVKGRDLYDYVFFLANDIKVNIELIKNKLIESKYIEQNSNFDINKLKKLLIYKFNEIDYKEAKEDVKPFIKDIDSLNIWSKEFFSRITENLK
ncbi:MAG: nucleotidyl transferase AbiEii/AbiGii toxin family protein [Bacilli bacterium]|nr:nucleotidyl transferase AbiEii/AbiGii toxin family protein [Bacilli bacterium]